ncbi:hypothetical protein QUB70_30595 [Microcoleus sp. A003_D6]
MNRQDACSTSKFICLRTGKMPVPQVNLSVYEQASIVGCVSPFSFPL